MPSSYNGWPASPDPGAIGVVPFYAGGTSGPFGSGGWAAGVKAGDVATVFTYLVDQYVATVEPLKTDPDTGQLGYGCWAYNYRANVNNPSTLSCHASGTALDVNATAHPNGASGTFTSTQVKAIRTILYDLGGAIRWGGDFTGTVDEMHFEVNCSAADLAQVAAWLPSAGPTPEPEPTPDPEDEDMIQLVQQAETGWLYAVAPMCFQVVAGDRADWGVAPGVYRAPLPDKPLNYVQLAELRDRMFGGRGTVVASVGVAASIPTGVDSGGNVTGWA